MTLSGDKVRLRALEPADIDLLYVWENDTAIWQVSGTVAPFSRHSLERFLDEQRLDIFQTKQQRLIIETLAGDAVGALDIFELDMINRRAGLGILIYDAQERGRGYASDAVAVVCCYAAEILHLHQLWCNVGADNQVSLALFRKAGFTDVGTKRDWQFCGDRYTDEIMMQKILKMRYI
jgi:diamine N-acetyltransferase